MTRLFPNTVDTTKSAMIFVDGENFAMRYQGLLDKHGKAPSSALRFEKDTYVWHNGFRNAAFHAGVRRIHYYTSVVGDTERITAVTDKLKDFGIEAPRVFKRTKGKGSKRVDVSLTTEMLAHAFRRNYDSAVLVAGDEDYVPLVEAVQSEGRRVLVWFVSEGLSPALKRAADYYVSLDTHMLSDDAGATWK